ncbi:hypothetical protein C8J57DRAFT_1521640 [Mycena rebaudengoi]|nr:hypothetical protein C8J57DRAFT_1521640 [Mycena rebaudengoi]
MAEFDLMTNQTRYRDFIEEKLNTTLSAHAGFSDDQAYGHVSIKSWTYNLRYTFSQSDISSGQSPVKAFPLSKVCQEATMAGGTFWSTTDRNNTDITALPLALFSSLLAEATLDPVYLQATTELADFIQAHLINDAKIVSDSVVAAKDRNCANNDL